MNKCLYRRAPDTAGSERPQVAGEKNGCGRTKLGPSRCAQGQPATVVGSAPACPMGVCAPPGRGSLEGWRWLPALPL